MSRQIKLIEFLLPLIAACWLATSASAQDKGKVPDKNAYRMRVSTWDKEAKLVRKKKAVPKVEKGTLLVVADLLSTGKKNPVNLFAGAVGYQRIQPNSAVRYASFKPVSLDPLKPSDIEVELQKGEILHRTAKLAVGSKYRSRSGPKLAASAGTAYSVLKKGEDIEVLVAEGLVKASLTGQPGKTLEIKPRQKATIGRTLPANALPVTRADEARIRSLLSLPVDNIIGYGDPVNLTRRDATEIVTLLVRPALKIERDGKTFAPFSIVVGENTFWSVDEEGTRREIGKGLKFLDATKNGSVVLGLDKDRQIVSQTLAGEKRRILVLGVERFISLAPNGARLVAAAEMFFEVKDEQSGKMKEVKGTSVNVFGVAYEGVSRSLVGEARATTVMWANGGNTCVLVHPIGKELVAELPLAGSEFMTQASLDRLMPLTVPADWTVSVASSGLWVWGQKGTEAKIASTRSGQSVSFSGVARIDEVPGSSSLNVYRTAGLLSRLDSPPDLVSVPAITELGKAEIPPKPKPFAVSPNGELVTFRGDETGTAIVADSLNLVRRSDSYVGILEPYACEWVSGDEVWYKDGEEEEEILIKLGVKRVGAVTRRFPGNYRPAYRPDQRQIDVSPLSYATEIVVQDVAPDGTIVGFTKTDSDSMGSGDFWVAAGTDICIPLHGPSFYPDYILPDGTWIQQYSAVLQGGTVVRPAIPRDDGDIVGVTSAGLVVITQQDTQGRAQQTEIMSRAYLWNPKAGPKPKPDPEAKGEAAPLIGGELALIPHAPKNAYVTGMNHRDELLWRENTDDERQEVWIQKIGEKPTSLGKIRGYGDLHFGDDGNLYLGGGEGDSSGRMTWHLTRITQDGDRTEIWRETNSSYSHLVIWGATQDGVVYGWKTKVDEKGRGVPDKAFVIVGTEFSYVDSLLPKGFHMKQFRRVTKEGIMCGSMYFNGKPVIYLPEIRSLLRSVGYTLPAKEGDR